MDASTKQIELKFKLNDVNWQMIYDLYMNDKQDPDSHTVDVTVNFKVKKAGLNPQSKIVGSGDFAFYPGGFQATLGYGLEEFKTDTYSEHLSDSTTGGTDTETPTTQESYKISLTPETSTTNQEGDEKVDVAVVGENLKPETTYKKIEAVVEVTYPSYLTCDQLEDQQPTIAVPRGSETTEETSVGYLHMVKESTDGSPITIEDQKLLLETLIFKPKSGQSKVPNKDGMKIHAQVVQLVLTPTEGNAKSVEVDKIESADASVEGIFDEIVESILTTFGVSQKINMPGDLKGLKESQPLSQPLIETNKSPMIVKTEDDFQLVDC